MQSLKKVGIGANKYTQKMHEMKILHKRTDRSPMAMVSYKTMAKPSPSMHLDSGANSIGIEGNQGLVSQSPTV